MPEDQIAAFCRRWKISQLELFGSILRDDFNDSSDVDMLVTFSEDAGWSLLDHVQMEAELEELLGREVDLISRRAVEQSHNWSTSPGNIGRGASYPYEARNHSCPRMT